MDPDAALNRVRYLVSEYRCKAEIPALDQCDMLAELVEALGELDEWMSHNGFLPQAWSGLRVQVAKPAD